MLASAPYESFFDMGQKHNTYNFTGGICPSCLYTVQAFLCRCRKQTIKKYNPFIDTDLFILLNIQLQ